MAKKKVMKTEDTEMKKAFQELLGSMDGAVIGSKVVTTEWVDTGIMGLNFLLSGDVTKGIPAGKITVVAGESRSGKSFLAGRIAANAQKQGFHAVWIDSERASDDKFFIRIGMDVDKVIFKHISDLGSLQLNILKLLNTAKNHGMKLFIVLDSLGNMSGVKEVKDAEEGKLTSDMGQRAKNVKSVIRLVSSRLGDSNSILFLVNHIYISPGFIPEIKQGGGLTADYLGQIILFLTRLKKGTVVGETTHLKVKADKNREFLEGRISEFFLNFRDGLNPKDGVLDLFEEFGVVTKKGGWYVVPQKDGTTKSVREADVYNNDELFNELLVILKEKTKDIAYHTFSDKDIKTPVLKNRASEIDDLVDIPE